MSETAILDDLKLINKAVNEASEHTKRQLDAIDSFSLVAIFSVIVAFGITYRLEISKYWIPSAFFLIILWGVYSFLIFKLKKSKNESFEQDYGDISKIKAYQISFKMELLIKNVLPFGNSLAMIFVISLIFILISPPSWFNFDNFIAYIPVVACIIWSIFPFIVDSLGRVFDTNNIKKIINRHRALTESEKIDDKKIFTTIGISFFSIVYVIFLLILPIISLFITYPSNNPFSENLRYFSLVLLLQIVALIMIARYFNALTVRKELTNTLTNYADIHSFISYYLISGDHEPQDIERLKHLFLTAKRFDVAVDNSFKLINFYTLIPHRVSQKEISHYEENILNE